MVLELFINLPVKRSIQPFPSYYKNLLGTYWQLSKYLHKALKHLVPLKTEKVLCQASIALPFPSHPLPPNFCKEKLLPGTPRICLNYPSITLGQEKREGKHGRVRRKIILTIHVHIHTTWLKSQGCGGKSNLGHWNLPETLCSNSSGLHSPVSSQKTSQVWTFTFISACWTQIESTSYSKSPPR